MEKWFVFSAFNSQSHFGFGTEAEAKTYADLVNAKREINVYAADEITDADTLAGLDSGGDTDGFRLDLAIDTMRENAENQAAEDAKYAAADADEMVAERAWETSRN